MFLPTSALVRVPHELGEDLLPRVDLLQERPEHVGEALRDLLRADNNCNPVVFPGPRFLPRPNVLVTEL